MREKRRIKRKKKISLIYNNNINKKQVDFANKNIEMIMQEAVEDLDRIE